MKDIIDSINLENARNEIIRFFTEYDKMDCLKSWDIEYYYKVYSDTYYENMIRYSKRGVEKV